MIRTTELLIYCTNYHILCPTHTSDTLLSCCIALETAMQIIIIAIFPNVITSFPNLGYHTGYSGATSYRRLCLHLTCVRRYVAPNLNGARLCRITKCSDKSIVHTLGSTWRRRRRMETFGAMHFSMDQQGISNHSLTMKLWLTAWTLTVELTAASPTRTIWISPCMTTMPMIQYTSSVADMHERYLSFNTSTRTIEPAPTNQTYNQVFQSEETCENNRVCPVVVKSERRIGTDWLWKGIIRNCPSEKILSCKEMLVNASLDVYLPFPKNLDIRYHDHWLSKQMPLDQVILKSRLLSFGPHTGAKRPVYKFPSFSDHEYCLCTQDVGVTHANSSDAPFAVIE